MRYNRATLITAALVAGSNLPTHGAGKAHTQAALNIATAPFVVVNPAKARLRFGKLNKNGQLGLSVVAPAGGGTASFFDNAGNVAQSDSLKPGATAYGVPQDIRTRTITNNLKQIGRPLWNSPASNYIAGPNTDGQFWTWSAWDTVHYGWGGLYILPYVEQEMVYTGPAQVKPGDQFVPVTVLGSCDPRFFAFINGAPQIVNLGPGASVAFFTAPAGTPAFNASSGIFVADLSQMGQRQPAYPPGTVVPGAGVASAAGNPHFTAAGSTAFVYFLNGQWSAAFGTGGQFTGSVTIPGYNVTDAWPIDPDASLLIRALDDENRAALLRRSKSGGVTSLLKSGDTLDSRVVESIGAVSDPNNLGQVAVEVQSTDQSMSVYVVGQDGPLYSIAETGTSTPLGEITAIDPDAGIAFSDWGAVIAGKVANSASPDLWEGLLVTQSNGGSWPNTR